MAASRTFPDGLKLAITVAFFFCLLFPPQSVLSRNSEKNLKNMVLGSKPPGCVNKCLSCRPCMATLVVPSNQKKSLSLKALSHGDDDDNGYYLLSWKCTCGDKLFQP